MGALTVAAQAAALWTGLSLILVVALSSLVVRRRRRHLVAFGDGGVPELTQATRAFGNAVEYIPLGLIGLVVLVPAGAPAWLIHVLGGGLFLGRVIHAAGLILTPGTFILRVAGMTLTWLALIVTAIVLIAYAVV